LDFTTSLGVAKATGHPQLEALWQERLQKITTPIQKRKAVVQIRIKDVRLLLRA
jgi:hypothetical protein